MTVTQISVFIENSAGKLADFADVLRRYNIDMRALSMSETRDFGILRVIVNDSYKTACVLKEAGYVFSITPVLAVAVQDETGSLFQILDILRDVDINLEYAYAFITRKKDLAYMILRVEDNDRAAEALSNRGIQLLSQEELQSI